jgi:hypothetical protein
MIVVVVVWLAGRVSGSALVHECVDHFMSLSGGQEPPQKRAKLVEHLQFSNAQELRVSLRDQDRLTVLKALRNQLSLKSDQEPISPQDERLLLAKNWVETDPGLRDVFDMWEGANQVRNAVHQSLKKSHFF